MSNDGAKGRKVPGFYLIRVGRVMLACILVAVAIWLMGIQSQATQLVHPTATPTPSISAQQGRYFANPKDAFSAVLNTYTQQVAPSRDFKLGEIHSDGAWAYAVAQEVDANGQEIPYHFIVLLGHYEPGEGWYAIAPRVNTAQEYNTLLSMFPDQLIDESTKAYLHQPKWGVWALNFSGHKLPWLAEQIGYVTKKDGYQHENQVDFDILGSGTSGDVYASKPGTVVFVKESSNSTCQKPPPDPCWEKANMVVIQHANSEYSWYVHLAYNSVPVSINETVGFGTKIGVEGQTGYSFGIHLHYMVSTGYASWTDPNDPNAAPWATGITAVDFIEVSWADLEVGQGYISQNDAGETCPVPTLLSPANGSTFLYGTDVALCWSGDADEYYAEEWGAASGNSGWTTNTCWGLGRTTVGTHYWHVKGRKGGVESDWSGTWSFTIVEGGESPIPLSPANGSTWPQGTSIRYEWTGSSDQYYCEVWGASEGNSGWTTNNFWQPGAPPQGTHYWHVKGRTGTTETGWSETWQFSISSQAVGGITLYEHGDYGGVAETFTSDDNNLGNNAIGHDRATSVRIYGPYITTLYEHDNYNGRAETFSHDDPNLTDNYIGSDAVSSLRVSPAVALYEHGGYEGRCETFASDDSNFDGSYIGHDTVTSLQVPPGYIATLCEHPNYEGACQSFTSDNPNLTGTYIGSDRASCITVVTAGAYDAEDGGTPDEFWLSPGQSFEVTVTARNSGSATWRSIHQVRLGLLSWNDLMGVTDLRGDLNSGENVNPRATRSWVINLIAPSTPGTYWQAWQMLREDGYVGWFGDLIRFEVHVLEPTPNPPTLSSPADGSTWPSNTDIVLSWSGEGSEYQLHFWDTLGNDVTLPWTSSTEWHTVPLAPAVYYWEVKARNAGGESGWSSTWSFTIIPNTPTGLSASAVSSWQIDLSWNDPGGEKDGYEVYRDGSYVGSTSSTNYQDTGLDCETAYFYYVKAYKGSFESDQSNTASATTQGCVPDPPSLVSPANGATLPHDADITLRWNSSGATEYYAHLWDGPSIDINSGWIGGTDWHIGQLWPGTYSWQVKARNQYGESGWSSTWTFTLENPPAVGPLVYDVHTVDDDNNDQSSGDGDGVVQCGETIELYISLRNLGDGTTTGVNATISTSDSYVTWLDNTDSSYPDIPGGGTGTNSDDFDFAVDPCTPDGHVITFCLDPITTGNGGPWSDCFDVSVTCVNNPPNTPNNPSLADGAVNQDINVDLSWTGGDPDPCDTVTYDVYFEANDSTPDNLICNDVFTPACDPGTLAYDTRYYWYIVATDNPGASTTGATWDFTTVVLSAPPAITSTTPNSGNNNEVVHITNLAGSDFQSGATVGLIKTGQADIVATNVVVVSSSRITCDLDLRGAASGQWTVRVTNPGTQYAELADGFTVKGIVYLPIILRNAR